MIHGSFGSSDALASMKYFGLLVANANEILVLLASFSWNSVEKQSEAVNYGGFLQLSVAMTSEVVNDGGGEVSTVDSLAFSPRSWKLESITLG